MDSFGEVGEQNTRIARCKMEKIALVSPYRSFGKLVQEVAAEISLSLDYFESDLHSCPKVLRLLEEDPPDVILSRGGLAAMLKKGTEIPVESVSIGIIDILKCCMEARNYSDHIAITSFENPLCGLEEIEEALNISITQIIFKDQEQLKEQIHFLAEETHCCLIGGGPTVKYAKRKNIQSVYLSTHPSTIRESLLRAIETAKLHQLIRKQKSRLTAILDSIFDGVIAIDEKGRLELINPSAEKILDLQGRDVIGQNIRRILPNSKMEEVLASGESQIGMIQQEGKVKIVTNRVPIRVQNKLVGAVATFQEAERVVRSEQKVRKQLLEGQNFSTRFSFNDIIGSSQIMSEKKGLAHRFSQSHFAVFLFGESGTGKELFAQSIHQKSTRMKRPFVAVNCGALPSSLLESELFGYDEGAFTGARKKGKMGLFELAHQGTLFLDEIDSLPIEFQGRLLRVIQEGELMRVGGERIIPVDVRIIAAANKHPETLLIEKKIRDDLYYRLNVLYLELPPLRERQEDIFLLAQFFLEQSGFEYLKDKLDGVRFYLENYSWPGNVRELSNVMERIGLYSEDCESGKIEVKEILRLIAPQIYDCQKQRTEKKWKQQEREWIEKVMDEKDSLTEVAKALGISRSTLWRKRKMFHS